MRRSRWSLLAGLVVPCVVALAAPALASASSISGTVSAEGGGPLQGVEVCPRPEPYSFETECVETDAAGSYQLVLPGGDYTLYFSAFRNNLRYVSEFYEDELHFWEADLFHLGSVENAVLDVELAEGGSIGGNVTDEVSDQPIEGIWACATDSEGIPARCARSDAGGDYLINGLPSGDYTVEYEGGNEVNYLREFYEDAMTWPQATVVPVTAPGTTAGIDAGLAPGAEILGHVSNVKTGAPESGVMVCAQEVEPSEYEGCDWTDSAGDYAIRSLRAGTYLVVFEPEYTPWGMLAEQWWHGASSAADAEPIVIAPPESRGEIDGQVMGDYVSPPEPETGPVAGTPPPPALPTTKQPQPLRKCKKGFHRKLVKGKRRCVRKHQQRRKSGKAGRGAQALR